MNYSRMEKYVKQENGKYMSVYVTKNESEINNELLDSLFWRHVIKSGDITKIVRMNSFTLTVYHSNGGKVVFSK